MAGRSFSYSSLRSPVRLCLAVVLVIAARDLAGAEMPANSGVERFRRDVQPLLAEYCYACHANGAAEGGVAWDNFASDEATLEDSDIWWRALKVLRVGLMPPPSEARPTAEQLRLIEDWVKADVFRIDPANPDPGRVTLRRLNRTEYRNTIRDLMGIEFNVDAEFPPDDAGHGFDNIGEVLTISPLLLEKYLAAAKTIVNEAVPTVDRVVRERTYAGKRFQPFGAEPADGDQEGALPLSYYEPAMVACEVKAKEAGRYQLELKLTEGEKFVDGVFDYNRCRLILKVDDEELLSEEFSWKGGKTYQREFESDWESGPHHLTIELQPLTPDEPRVRSLVLRIESVTVRGPIDDEHRTLPPNYERFFPDGVPDDQDERRAYAKELLRNFATKAFRRPVDEESVDRLATIAEAVFSQEGSTVETGIAQAMTAVLASPRFLFREEEALPGEPGVHPMIDEYALATRLSYFFWSTMPDEELFRLAREGQLRANLPAQVSRMLTDSRSEEFVENFVGQWLQVRDISSIQINAFAVMSRETAPDPEADRRRSRFRELRRRPPESLSEEEKKELDEARASFRRSANRFQEFELNGDLRRAMRRETEMLFEHILREDRSLLELIDCDYTFLNERLAKHYGIEGVEGEEMRLVELPEDSPRGGVLTQGTVLCVTSNPDRTSPVKRGLFILSNILGTPPAPPPPNIPALEDSEKPIDGRTPTLRESLARHRSDALCSSCHSRMDPPGLALENFNALGRWRDQDRGQPVDAAGELITGETFSTVQELKQVLANDHRRDFYRCLTEKLLTYALGRGLDYHDVHTVDLLVERLEQNEGRPSTLLMGIVESAPFQRRRATSGPSEVTDSG